jgi:hypothetical protein
MADLKQSNLVSPTVASRFVETYRKRYGGIDGLAEKLFEIIESDDHRAAIKALELYVAMVQLSTADDQARFLLDRDRKRRKKPEELHRLYNCPF